MGDGPRGMGGLGGVTGKVPGCGGPAAGLPLELGTEDAASMAESGNSESPGVERLAGYGSATPSASAARARGTPAKHPRAVYTAMPKTAQSRTLRTTCVSSSGRIGNPTGDARRLLADQRRQPGQAPLPV